MRKCLLRREGDPPPVGVDFVNKSVAGIASQAAAPAGTAPAGGTASQAAAPAGGSSATAPGAGPRPAADLRNRSLQTHLP